MCSTDLAVLDLKFPTIICGEERKIGRTQRSPSTILWQRDDGFRCALPILKAYKLEPAMSPAPIMTASCVCGRVKLRASGKPIMSAVCYCNDCQNGAAQIEALPNAAAVRESDGGTSYILYRKDRFECADGAGLLRPCKLKVTSPTNRVAATCCNSAMFMNFDRGPHWVSVYRARCHGELPPLQARIFAKSRAEGVVLADDVPSYKSFPPSFIVKMITSRIAMALGR